ncbi:hypothetical protein ACFE04_003443 [Oxalis oulophora]
MCIAVFMWQSHSLYPFLLLLNRDEYHSRPTKELDWWEDGEILGGRDELAGGTWLACSKHGKIAFLTNVRSPTTNMSQAKSRGDLPVRFLLSQKTLMEFADELVKEADQYNGFNLILADVCSKSMVYVTNKPKEKGNFITEVPPGVYVLSNANLNSPWPKAERLSHGFKELLNEYGHEGELPVKEMVEKLMRNTIKDEDKSLLPGVLPAEWEYHLSSIFIDVESPRLGRYGTRSSSALFVKSSEEVCFYEKSLKNGSWQDKTVTIKPRRICITPSPRSLKKQPN